jgi:hypothetical protein
MPDIKTRTDGKTVDLSLQEANQADIAGQAQRVLNVPSRTLIRHTANFVDSEGNAEMNVSVGFSGTPAVIHDGTDSSAWTGSNVSGVAFIFDSTTQAHSGTKSISGVNTQNGNTCQFNNHVTLTGYIAITGWVYITSWPSEIDQKVNLYAWDIDTSQMVGNAVNIGDYVDITSLDNWQYFIIPLAHLGLNSETGIGAIRIQTVDTGTGLAPDYYLDDLQFEEAGGVEEFSIAPPAGYTYYVDEYDILLVDEYSGILENATGPALSYNKLLGESELTNGIIFQVKVGGSVIRSGSICCLKDLLVFLPEAEISSFVTDGTNSMLKIKYKLTYPTILRSSLSDEVRIIIQDVLTGLISFRVTAVGRRELEKVEQYR